MSDDLPANCRFRLQQEGKPYPRSSCTACGKSIVTGLGNHCAASERFEARPAPSLDAEIKAIWAALLHEFGPEGMSRVIARLPEARDYIAKIRVR